MKKQVHGVLACLGLLLPGLAAREFTSADGRKINGELLAHSGDGVVLKVGAKEFVVPISSFSADDQQFIKTWMEENPGALRFKFGFFFDFEELRGDRTQGKAPGSMIDDKLKITPHLCKMILFNKEVVPAEGVEIRYEIYIDDFVDVRNKTYTRMAVGGAKRAVLETVAGRLEVPRLEAGGRIDFSRVFDMHFYIDRDGGKTDEAAKDKLRGARIRIYRGDAVVAEAQSAETGREIDSIPWQDAEPNGETVVKNRSAGRDRFPRRDPFTARSVTVW